MEPERVETYEFRTERDEQSPRRVQRWLQDLPIQTSQELILLTHELVVNAVMHTNARQLWITLLICPDVVHVQVANEGTRGRPRVLSRRPFSESGRGLRWVDSLSTKWGVGRTRATHVWFQVPRSRRGLTGSEG